MKTITFAVYGLPIVLLLSACGGGGSSTDDNIETGGIEGGGAAVLGIEGGGVLAQVSSDSSFLSVGGKQLDVTDSGLTVTVDAQPATLQTLRVGDRIYYSGTTSDDGDTVVVMSISQDDLVEGPVDAGSINVDAGTFSVLGQNVQVNSLTVFADAIQPNDIGGLMDGDFLEISGEISAEGVIEATRIERESNDNDFEVTGIVTSVDTANFRFVLNGLTVDYASAELEGFRSNDPQVGDRVEVEGEQLDADGVLISDEVELESLDFEGDDGDLAEIEGFVTALVGPEQFELGGQPVMINAQTSFEGGIAGDIALGSRLEVSGELDANGVLQASEVEFEGDEADSRIGLEGPVNEIDLSANSVVVLGVTVRITPATRLEGDDDMPLTLEQLAVGSVLEVRGVAATDAPAVLVATRLELEDEGDEVSVTGPIEALADPGLTVFGVAVATDAETEFDGDEIESAADFFSTAVVGDFVEVEGTFDGMVLQALEVEQDDD